MLQYKLGTTSLQLLISLEKPFPALLQNQSKTTTFLIVMVNHFLKLRHFIRKTSFHYENTPMQYTENFLVVKN